MLAEGLDFHLLSSSFYLLTVNGTLAATNNVKTAFQNPSSTNEQTLYINRGLSWLEFNQRVLDQAFDAENRLLERLKFLGIVSSNLDEFFEVHVAALKQQCQSQQWKRSPDGLRPQEELSALSPRIRQQVVDQ